ncbi:MAG: 5-bromo-4-chloroindolyl phosphate hydrolysis family protein [Eggerthellaceae bacterium]
MGEDISRTIDQIEHTYAPSSNARRIPQVINDLDRLMDYYLPTTVKLLDAYKELDAQPIQGENIQKSKKEIEAALDTLSTAFEKLLDSVFKEMAWDVSTDISVLHTVLAQEGLVEDPFTKMRP